MNIFVPSFIFKTDTNFQIVQQILIINLIKYKYDYSSFKNFEVFQRERRI